MRSVEIETFAKINLTLDVRGKRPDGYHELITVMQSISLSDQVMILERDEPGIQLICSAPIIPTDLRNTAYRAATRFLDVTGLNAGLSIIINKRIPIAAGLAGGSSDAAGVLAALDWLYPNLLDRQSLFAIASDVGADVPFCLAGGTVLCTGIGDILTPLKPLNGWPLVLIKAPFGLSTPEVFRRFEQLNAGYRPNHDKFLNALDLADWPGMSAAAGNALESVAFAMHPQLRSIKEQLASTGAVLTQMSGSGPTLFSVYADLDARDMALVQLKSLSASGFSLFSAQMVPTGTRRVASDTFSDSETIHADQNDWPNH